MGADEIEILRNRFDRIHLEPPRDPAQDRRALVMAEVVASLRPHVEEHFAYRRFIFFVVRFVRDRLAPRCVLDFRVRLFGAGDFRR